MIESEDPQMLIESIVSSLKLSTFGRKSFLELCNKGCHPETLESLLIFLFSKVRVKGAGTFDMRDRKAVKMVIDSSLRPLDSFSEALGEFDKRQIPTLQKKLLNIAAQIEALNNTNLVYSIGIDNYGVDARLLPKLLTEYAEKVIPLVEQKLGEIGERVKPQFTTYLIDLVSHVKESTGSPNYKLVCDVLNDFGLDWDEDSLKQRVHRQIRGSKKVGDAK